MASTRGRSVVVPLTNKSGGGVVAGDVVIVDSANNDAFTTTTTGGYTGGIGIAQQTIANNDTGRVLISGYAALVNVNASVTRGDFGKTHTVAKQATDAGASRTAGTFCIFLTGGTTPDAMLFGNPDLAAAAGNVAADAIWDAKGDLAVGTGADTASRLAVGANGKAIVADSTQSTGLAWVDGPLRTIVKPTDQAVINSAVLTDDTALQFAMAASTKYFIRITVFFDTTAAGDFKWNCNAPASPGTIRYAVRSAIAGGGIVANGAIQGAFGPPGIQTPLTGSGTVGGYVQLEIAYQNGANAGTFSFQFAQNTQTNDTGAIVLAGSSLEYKAA